MCLYHRSLISDHTYKYGQLRSLLYASLPPHIHVCSSGAGRNHDYSKSMLPLNHRWILLTLPLCIQILQVGLVERIHSLLPKLFFGLSYLFLEAFETFASPACLAQLCQALLHAL